MVLFMSKKTTKVCILSINNCLYFWKKQVCGVYFNALVKKSFSNAIFSDEEM